MLARYTVVGVILALAFWRLWMTRSRGVRGAALLLGTAALGAVVSDVLSGGYFGSDVPRSSTRPPERGEVRLLYPHPNSEALPSESERRDLLLPQGITADERNRLPSPRAHRDEGSQIPRVSEVVHEVRTPELVISPSGRLATSGSASLHAELRSEISRRQLHPAGELRIQFSMNDLQPTLGQIPTCSLTASWTLVDSQGNAVASGGVSDLRGTGIDEQAAELAAIRWGAREIALQIGAQSGS